MCYTRASREEPAMNEIDTSMSLRRARQLQCNGGTTDEVMRAVVGYVLDAMPIKKRDLTDADLDLMMDRMQEAYGLPPLTDQEKQEERRESYRMLATLAGQGYIFTEGGLERQEPANT